MWTAWLIAVHLLALPGAYMLLGFLLTMFLESTTNPLTGQPKPWARGIGWAVIGGAVVAALCLAHNAYGADLPDWRDARIAALERELAAVKTQLKQETSDRKAWQLESQRWMKRWSELRDHGRDYFREALDAAVEKERAFQESRKP